MTGETTAFANATVFDGGPAELREGCVRDPSVLWGGPVRRAVFQGGVRVAERDARLVL